MAYSTKNALLGGVIDYAGTFPPAALSLPDALKSAASFRARARHPWLMGRCAVTLADLKKIDPKAVYEKGAGGEAWIFAALGTPVKEPGASEFLRTVEWDLREIRRYNERGFDSSCRLFVAAYETKVPAEAFADAATAHEYLSPVLDRFAALPRHHVDPFFEVSLEGDFKASLGAATEAIHRWMKRDDEGRVMPGLKFRTGGNYVPTAEQLASAVLACTTHGLRFKATQGLHHAVSQKGAFGFVNLFSSLAFAQALGAESFGLDDVRRCLEETDAAHFELGAQTLRWRDRELGVEAIEAARRQHGATFGSCSVDEPDESLAETFKEN